MDKSITGRINTLLIRLAVTTSVVVLVSILLVSSFTFFLMQTEMELNSDNFYCRQFEYSCELVEQQVFTPVVQIWQEFSVLKTWSDVFRGLPRSKNGE